MIFFFHFKIDTVFREEGDYVKVLHQAMWYMLIWKKVLRQQDAL